MTGWRLTLAYRDTAKALRFWRDRCGFRAGPEAPASLIVLRRGPVEIRIVDAASLPATSPLGRRLGKATGGSVRVELVLEPSEKIADWFVRLEQSGADIAEPLGEWAPGERSFTVADPGGYLVTFIQPGPRP